MATTEGESKTQAAMSGSEKLGTIIIRAIVIGFITIAAGLFVLVFLAVFGGLPLVFA